MFFYFLFSFFYFFLVFLYFGLGILPVILLFWQGIKKGGLCTWEFGLILIGYMV